MAKHLLSICIPTNGIARWVVPVVRNIYEVATDLSLFEVVVADNGDESELSEPINEFEKFSNFRYIRTNATGFYNIIENFTLARGDFMFKINHRCMIRKGMIEYIYGQAEKYYSQRPLMYFSNGHIGKRNVQEFLSFDRFLYELSYWSSLSEGLFFWKSDLDNIPNIKFAKMSPNVSLMFDSRHKDHFVIDDSVFGSELDSSGKYGYDLFDTFAVLYLDLVNEVRAEGCISKETFIKVKKDIFSFLSSCYLQMGVLGRIGNYELTGIKDSLSIYYSKYDYWYMILKEHTLGLARFLINCVRYKIKKSYM